MWDESRTAVLQPKWKFCVLYRAGTLFGATPIPVLDSSGGIAPFCDATGQFMPLLCTMNCTLAPEEVGRLHVPREKQSFSPDKNIDSTLMAKSSSNSDPE